MKVGVLGTGDVGRVLARGFAAKGHAATVGTRDPTKGVAWAAGPPPVAVATMADAARGADLVVLATKGGANADVIQAVGPEALAGKLVLDATNPLDFAGGRPGLLSLPEGSGGAQVQALAPKARVVKCFNTVGHGNMVDPQLPHGPPTMFIAGNDAQAKQETRAVLREFGWPDVLDCGGIEASRYLEGMVMVWVAAYGARGKGDHAFRLIHP